MQGRRRSTSSSDGEAEHKFRGPGIPQPSPISNTTMNQAPSFPVASPSPTTNKGFNPPSSPPPPYAGQGPPASGFRVPLTTQGRFASQEQVGERVFHDADRVSPVFFGSAIMGSSVHPCKVGPHLNPPCRVPYAGQEFEHHGRYDLLPYDSKTMELVPTSGGRLPPGKRAIVGGYEENGSQLYHALATVNGTRVPGKTGEHLFGCNVAFGGQEHVVQSYDILCWRY